MDVVNIMLSRHVITVWWMLQKRVEFFVHELWLHLLFISASLIVCGIAIKGYSACTVRYTMTMVLFLRIVL